MTPTYLRHVKNIQLNEIIIILASNSTKNLTYVSLTSHSFVRLYKSCKYSVISLKRRIFSLKYPIPIQLGSSNNNLLNRSTIHGTEPLQPTFGTEYLTLRRNINRAVFPHSYTICLISHIQLCILFSNSS